MNRNGRKFQAGYQAALEDVRRCRNQLFDDDNTLDQNLRDFWECFDLGGEFGPPLDLGDRYRLVDGRPVPDRDGPFLYLGRETVTR